MSRIAGLIELRRYRPEEAAATLAVFRAAVRRTALADYSLLQVETWAPDLIDATAWAERRAAIAAWVADVEGEVAGFVDLSAEGLVDMLYVHPIMAVAGSAPISSKWSRNRDATSGCRS